MLDYNNNLYGTSFASWDEMKADSTTWNKFINATANFGQNSQFTMTVEQLEKYLAEYPQWDEYIYAMQNSDGTLDVQLKFPEEELAELSYDIFYQELLAIAYGDECADMNSNRNTAFTRTRGIGDYMTVEALYQQTDDYFDNLENADLLEKGETMAFTMTLSLDGPGTGNAYQLYDFQYLNSISFRQMDTTYQVVHQYYTSTDGGEYVLDGTVT